jgi:lysophospholipid acyltransferase (LPLAT)-like uncharacterized protein
VKKWVFSKIVASIANAIIWALVKTCKIKITNLEHLTISGGKKQILMLWHNRLIITPQLLHKITPQQTYAAVVSNSQDGELLSKMICRYSNGSVIRVSHDMRHQGLRKMVQTLKQNKTIPVITPDGPRGPRYSVKGGVVLAAKGSDAVIIPMSWSSSRFWEFKTWDGLRLPKPFSALDVTFGEPIDLTNHSGSEAITLLEKRMNSIS